MFKLSRKERLAGWEMRRVFSLGDKFSSGSLKMVCLRRRGEGVKAGFTVRGCRHSAVLRNSCKRLLREVYRLNKNRINEGIWMVLILENPGRRPVFSRLEVNFLKICREAGIITGQAP